MVCTLRFLRLPSVFLLLAALGCGGTENTDPFVVGPAGGTVTFDEGIVLTVPPGALSEDTRFEATLLDPDETEALLAESGNHPRHFLAGVSIEPSGLAFATPAQVTMPLQRTPSARGLPFHFVLDPDYNAYYPAATNVSVDPEASTVTLSLDSLSPHTVAEVEEIIARICAEEPCRCGRVTVQESTRNFDFYNATGEDCRAAEIRGTATYHECGDGGTTESWLFVEHSEGCVPRLELTPESETMMPGESKPFSLRLEYVGRPYPAGELSLRSSDAAVATPSTAGVITGPDGRASFEVMGRTEGTAALFAEGSIRYRPREITINGMVQELEERTKTVRDRSSVFVGSPPRLVLEIQPGPDGDFLRPGQSTTARVRIVAQNEGGDGTHLLSGVRVSLSASAGELSATSIVTSGGPQLDVVGFTAPDEEGEVTITARAEVSVLTPTATEVTYPLEARDSIRVQSRATERWTGFLDVNYGIHTADSGAAQLNGSVRIDFALNYDPDASPEPNVESDGGTAISSIIGRDSDPRTAGSCQITEYWTEVMGSAFAVNVEGMVLSTGTRDSLYIRFPRADMDPFAPMATAQLNEREVCDGVSDEFLLSTYEIFWQSGVASLLDPNQGGGFCGSGASSCLFVDVSEAGEATIEGSCAIEESDSCSYSLSITRPE